MSAPLYAVPDARPKVEHLGGDDYTLAEAADTIDAAQHLLPVMHPDARITVSVRVTIEHA